MCRELLDLDIDEYLIDEAHADNVVVDIVRNKILRVSLFKEGHYKGDVWIDLVSGEVLDNWSMGGQNDSKSGS